VTDTGTADTQAGPRRWPGPELTRRIFAVGVLVQMGIVFTGGLVRLTDSGLGCPTWPQCVPGSYTPVPYQKQSFHKYIEFGNRTLTIVLVATVVACLIAAWRMRPRRRPLVLLALGGVLGVFAQAVLGGISVLTHLNPYVVAAHFLLSIVLIAVALALYERSQDAGDGPPRSLVRPEVHWLSRALVATGALVLVLGTLVTGSGPYSGDTSHTARTGLDPSQIAWVHADVVMLFVGLVVAMLIALRLTPTPETARRRAWILFGVTLAQGAVGYTQYFTGLPWLLVSLHVLGATLLWVSVLRLTYALRARDIPTSTGSLSASADAGASPLRQTTARTPQ
jgi:heme a synthase